MRKSFSPAVNTMFIFPVGKEEAEKIGAALNPYKSTGLDGIFVKKLKSMLQNILPHLTELINSSIYRGIFHDCLKKALTTKLFTKDKCLR